jgi:hypothetical protein
LYFWIFSFSWLALNPPCVNIIALSFAITWGDGSRCGAKPPNTPPFSFLPCFISENSYSRFSTDIFWIISRARRFCLILSRSSCDMP